MKILLLGRDGQVGRELQRSLSPLGNVIAWSRQQADLEDLAALSELVRKTSPQWIVNAAAYTAVDNAEAEPEPARRINTEAVAVLAEEAKRLDACLVHYSTDYVFDGNKNAPYTEDDTPNPLSVYGLSKRAGEEAIAASACRHLILRTSWVYSAHGSNFAKTMLHLGAEREELKIVADQIGAPTSAGLIADVTALCVYRMLLDPAFAARVSGTYHLAATGETSWHGYAQYVVGAALRRGARLRISPDRILPITSVEHPLPAKRPANSRLDTHKLCATFGLVLPPWQQDVARVIEALLPAQSIPQ